MANIRISDIEAEASSLNGNDLLLISQDNGDNTFTSAKMKASVLKASIGECQFTDQKVINACTSALNSKGVSTLTSAQVQSACSTAISSTSVKVSGTVIDPTLNKIFYGEFAQYKELYPNQYTTAKGVWGKNLPSSDAGYGRCKFKLSADGTVDFVLFTFSYDIVISMSTTGSEYLYQVIDSVYLIPILFETRYIPKNTQIALMDVKDDSKLQIYPIK